MATKIELETRIRELERRFENDEQDMVPKPKLFVPYSHHRHRIDHC